jgi:hypothetical protein
MSNEMSVVPATYSKRVEAMGVLLNLPESYVPVEAKMARNSVDTDDIRLRLMLAINTGPPWGMKLCIDMLPEHLKTSGSNFLQAEERKKRSDILFANGVEWAEASKQIRVQSDIYRQTPDKIRLMKSYETFVKELAIEHPTYRADGLFFAMMGLHRMASSRSKRKTQKQTLVFAKCYTGAQSEAECRACITFLHKFRDTHLCTEQAKQDHPKMLAAFLHSVTAATATAPTPATTAAVTVAQSLAEQLEVTAIKQAPLVDDIVQTAIEPPQQQKKKQRQGQQQQPRYANMTHYAAKALQRPNFIEDFRNVTGLCAMMAPIEVAKLAFGAYVLNDINHSPLYQHFLKKCRVSQFYAKRISAYTQTRPKLDLACWKELMQTLAGARHSRDNAVPRQNNYIQHFAQRVPLPVYINDADRAMLAFTSLQPNYKNLFKQVTEGMSADTRKRLHEFHFDSVASDQTDLQTLLESTFHTFLCQTQRCR